jgi:hypothetical protein
MTTIEALISQAITEDESGNIVRSNLLRRAADELESAQSHCAALEVQSGEIQFRYSEAQKRIAELETAKARLDWLVKTGRQVNYRMNNISEGWACEDSLARFTARTFSTPEQAIDAAMKETP